MMERVGGNRGCLSVGELGHLLESGRPSLPSEEFLHSASETAYARQCDSYRTGATRYAACAGTLVSQRQLWLRWRSALAATSRCIA
jgi:hypothetical protein